MIWPFRRPARERADADWWRQADEVVAIPTTKAIDRLRQHAPAAGGSTDDAERREEFLEGLTQVLELSHAAALPIVVTQHRVIGHDTCHFVEIGRAHV